MTTYMDKLMENNHSSVLVYKQIIQWQGLQFKQNQLAFLLRWNLLDQRQEVSERAEF